MTPAPPKKPRRFNWHRRYHSGDWCDLAPKWRVVASRANVRLVEVLAVKNYLDDRAGIERKRGSVGAFDIHECAVGLDLPPETVASIVRVLVDLDWLTRNHVIQDWLVRQPPEKEDETAAQRQRNKRARDEARTRAAIGIASEDDLELLAKPEREALARLAALSRVTASQPAEPPAEVIAAFAPVKPYDDTQAARDLAEAENARLARRWLLGDGTSLVNYGPASKIVADNFGCNRMSADGVVRRWLTELANDAAKLASIISGAEEQALNGEAFRSVVEQRIAEAIRLQVLGSPLPFPPQALKGRAS
jgi:hypothetical protein